MAEMTKLKSKLLRMLRQQFAGAELDIRYSEFSGKLEGTIVWKGFAGMDQVDRQRALRSLVQSKLTQDERACLSGIFTMTPEEIAVMREG